MANKLFIFEQHISQEQHFPESDLKKQEVYNKIASLSVFDIFNFIQFFVNNKNSNEDEGLAYVNGATAIMTCLSIDCT